MMVVDGIIMISNYDDHNEQNSLCISCLGIFSNSSDSFLQMCSERGITNRDLRFIIFELSATIIQTSYYIFCM